MSVNTDMKMTPLYKNTACLVCRSRKVRCDGVRPICGTCVRSARAQRIPPEERNCTWPSGSPPPPQSSIQPSNRLSKKEEQERKIAELEERTGKLILPRYFRVFLTSNDGVARLEELTEVNIEFLRLLRSQQATINAAVVPSSSASQVVEQPPTRLVPPNSAIGDGANGEAFLRIMEKVAWKL
ncbi:hypothetical protein BT69DRAFT_132054 [Atractiella rhizophila]|nr:hypothetical protein BT69DRAFT_132054 [Atractiella rhizophila]